MAIFRDNQGVPTTSVTDATDRVVSLSTGSNTVTPTAGTIEIRITPSVAINIRPAGGTATGSNYPIGAGVEYILPIANWNGTRSFSVYAGGAGTLSIMELY